MKEIFPTTIDIKPTASCNMSCRFCYSPDYLGNLELNFNQWCKIIDFFATNGTKSIIVTGGEPLLFKDIIPLIKYIKDKNLRVTLSTNTLLLKRFKNNLLKYVDDIGIPLDGYDMMSNFYMRQGSLTHFASVIDSLNYIKKNNNNIFITVRTVLSKKNFQDIEKIGEVLESRLKEFDRWKIYQFVPLGKGKKNKKEFFISSDKFLKKIEELKIRFKNINIEASLYKDGIGKYLFINPQGNIYGVKNSKEVYSYGVNFFESTEAEVKNSIMDLVVLRKNIQHGT